MNQNKLTKVKKDNTNEKQEIYPFVDEMVNAFYTENCNALIKKSVESQSDKGIFLMFMTMYFGIHLKLEGQDDELKKQQIKILLSDLVRDPQKRKYCIETFGTFIETKLLNN